MTVTDQATPTHLREAQELAGIEQRMLAAFSPPLPSGDVCRAVAEAVAEFGSARFRQYVPVLVERTVRERLRLMARAQQRHQPVDSGQTVLGGPVRADHSLSGAIAEGLLVSASGSRRKLA